MIKRIILQAIIISIAFFSCKKDKKMDELPPITKTGANTFGCILDNRIFASTLKCPRPFSIWPLPCVNASIYRYHPPFNSFTELNIEVKNNKFIENGEVLLNLRAEVDTVSYKITKIDEGSLSMQENNTNTNYQIDFSKTNLFNATMTNEIVSGTFELYFKSVNGDTKVLKDGRFDISFR